MTISEIDRISRILTDMRIDSAAQFARLEERLSSVPDLALRVVALEKQGAQAGRFSWSDVFKVVTAVGVIVGICATVAGSAS